jgi:hypothetical protein
MSLSGTVCPGVALAAPPHELVPGRNLGAGQRATVFLGRWRGASVVIKQYHPAQVVKHRQRFGRCIASYECARNRALYAIEAIRPFVARPYGVWPQPGSGAPCFVQEYVSGGKLERLAEQLGYVPAEIVEQLEAIVRTAAADGIHDLDLKPHNIGVRWRAGMWQPMLFDFNCVPHFHRAPNPWIALMYRMGVRDRGYRDRCHLRALRRMLRSAPAASLAAA